MNLLDLFVKVSVKDEATAGVSTLSTNIKGTLADAAKVGAIAVTAVTAAVTAFSAACVSAIKDVAAYGDEIDKMSQKMGMSAEAYQEWDAVMKHSGTSMETMKASMKTLASAAETGNEAFQRIGITQEQIASMSQEELFEATIRGLQNVTDETERTYLAGQLMGRGATELGALLNMTAEETDQMRQRVHELGGVMSDEAVKAAAAFQDSLQDLQTAFDGLKNKMVSEFLPAATQVTDGLTEIFAGNVDKGAEMVEEGIDAIIEKATEMLPKILEVGGKIIGSLISSFVKNLPKLVDTFLKGLADMIDSFADHTDEFVEAAGDFIMGIGTAIAENAPKILAALGKLLINLVVSLVEHIPDMLAAAVDMFGGLLLAIADVGGQLLTSIGNLLIDAVNAIGDAVGNFFYAGRMLMQGLIDGFKSLASEWLQAVSGTIKEADGTVRYVGQIYSPSKLFAKRGRQLMEGLAQGIEDGEAMVEDALSGLSSTMDADMPTFGGELAVTARSADAASKQLQPIELHVHVEARSGEDWGEVGRRVGSAAAYELRMQGVSA